MAKRRLEAGIFFHMARAAIWPESGDRAQDVHVFPQRYPKAWPTSTLGTRVPDMILEPSRSRHGHVVGLPRNNRPWDIRLFLLQGLRKTPDLDLTVRVHLMIVACPITRGRSAVSIHTKQ